MAAEPRYQRVTEGIRDAVFASPVNVLVSDGQRRVNATVPPTWSVRIRTGLLIPFLGVMRSRFQLRVTNPMLPVPAVNSVTSFASVNVEAERSCHWFVFAKVDLASSCQCRSPQYPHLSTWHPWRTCGATVGQSPCPE
jgi:hypothetical protein